ncbi:MAG: aminotransferase class I/II-fold pyridoxal phosphate-dependent enzyme [Phycisphaerales bacterium]|nr:aminotransferase class I/II-fold pyridoxal phosphate-dependent enzyme [Phycisphaerales bacterium]
MSGVPDIDRLLSSRVRGMEASGIRRIWQLGQECDDPINLSIGQPDFLVPKELQEAAIEAIRDGCHGYTLTTGDESLRQIITTHLHATVGWPKPGEETSDVLVTSGTAGGLTLAALALLDPGDELIIPDPYFVIYPNLAKIAGAVAVLCDTYPDFRMTAERIEPLLTDRTKAVFLNSPANPTGVVLTDEEVADIVALCHDRGVLLITDEIYDRFVFPPAADPCPTAASHTSDMLLVRGFGKTHGCTGWRLGYAAGPRSLIQEMAKIQQHTFVCAPSMAQRAMHGAFDVDLDPLVRQFTHRRDMVVAALCDVTDLVMPEGAFYAFPKVPEHLGISATAFVEAAIERNVLVIPGDVFSPRDTHFRLSFAAPEPRLAEGLSILRSLITSGV